MKCPVCKQVAIPLGPLGWGGEREWKCPTGVKFRTHADHSVSLMPKDHSVSDAAPQPPSPTYTLEQDDIQLLRDVARVLGIFDQTSMGIKVENLIQRLSQTKGG